MKTIKVKNYELIPEYYTGIVEFPSGFKLWLRNGRRHREDGAARIWPDEYEEHWLNGAYYARINLKNYIVLDQYQGEYDLMWYKLLGKDEIFEYPDIPGLITK